MNRQFSFIMLVIALTGFASGFLQAAEIQKFPDVLDVKVEAKGQNRFDFDVTISSPYDTPQRYADGFQVMGERGESYGVRKLHHDHEDEQPFTRELYNVFVPAGVQSVVVQARDQKYGYGGKRVQVRLPGR